MSLVAVQDLDNPGTAGNLLQQADLQRYPMAVDLQNYSPRFFCRRMQRFMGCAEKLPIEQRRENRILQQAGNNSLEVNVYAQF